MRLLIEHGADVTAQDESSLTPLHLASSSGIPNIMQLLLEYGTLATAQDRRRKTPLHLALLWVSTKNCITFLPQG